MAQYYCAITCVAGISDVHQASIWLSMHQNYGSVLCTIAQMQSIPISMMSIRYQYGLILKLCIRHQWCASGINMEFCSIIASYVNMTQFRSIICILHQYGSVLCIMHQNYGSIMCTVAQCCASTAHWYVHQASVWIDAVHQASILPQCCASMCMLLCIIH